MATYSNLELDHYYLIKETEGNEIILVQVVLETAKSLLLLHIDEIESTVWKKKDDVVFEIVEELTQEQVDEYEDLFEDEEDDWSIDDIEFEEDAFGDEDEDEDEEEDEDEDEDPIK